MGPLQILTPSDAHYPPRLRIFERPPELITVEGSLDAPFVVAIVGTREPDPKAEELAEELAEKVAGAGAAVVSGGAIGIDAAAHRGSLAARGATWCVAPTGHLHAFPPENLELFARIRQAESGTFVWPFPPDTGPSALHFFLRNAVLVALADVVVVVQAGIPSGALNAASAARRLGRPLWIVPGSPWVDGFKGCLAEIERGARVLTSVDRFLSAVGLASRRVRPARSQNEKRAMARARTAALPLPLPQLPPSGADTLALFATDSSMQPLLEAISAEPRHVDEIAARARVCASAAATALLTMALENVVVEGPAGFYRRRNLG